MSEEQKTRILFVDDEEVILKVLQRALKPLSAEWDMSFVESGEAALRLMQDTTFDVVVSDMRMHGMSGADLLNHIRRRYPATIRVILTGHSDEVFVLKCVGAAHQFLMKPFSLPELRAGLNRIFGLKKRLRSEPIRQLVTGIDCLPSMPSVYARIIETLQKPDSSLEQIARIVEEDPGLTSKLLQLVNSAFFGFASPVSSAEEACMLLGVGTIRSLALMVHVFSAFDARRYGPGFLDGIWSHSLRVGSLARKIAAMESTDEAIAEQSFTAGLLHDIGKLILAEGYGASYVGLSQHARDNSLSLAGEEEKTFHVNHADVGAYLLDLWALPIPLVEAVAFHHEPYKSPEIKFSPLTTVHAANALELERELSDQRPGVSLLNPDYLDALELRDRVEVWRAISNAAA